MAAIIFSFLGDFVYTAITKFEGFRIMSRYPNKPCLFDEQGHFHIIGFVVVLVLLIAMLMAYNSAGGGADQAKGPLTPAQEKDKMIADLIAENTLLKQEVERLDGKLKSEAKLCDMLREHDAQSKKKRPVGASSDQELEELRKRAESTLNTETDEPKP
jgi:hypothetical protein